jgi:glycerol-3-phosphate dehydrogenase
MEAITERDILTSSGKYPGRAIHPECTDEVKSNAHDLAARISGLLMEIERKSRVNSGFRTSDVNAKTKGAAKKSHHMKANAADLEGDELAYYLLADYINKGEDSLLVRHDLYLEDPRYTKNWTHIQRVPPKSGKRVFIP